MRPKYAYIRFAYLQSLIDLLETTCNVRIEFDKVGEKYECENVRKVKVKSVFDSPTTEINIDAIETMPKNSDKDNMQYTVDNNSIYSYQLLQT